MADIDKGEETQVVFKLFGTTIPLEIKNVTVTATDKSVQKAEKTIQCPRCKSMETKFCYFNNYNFKQPRHFCKGCQRYWTAGGTLRNVPIGAGRRKTRPLGHGSTGFSNDFMFDVSEVKEFDFNRVVEQWHLATSRGGFGHSFQAKRRCNGSDG